MTSLLFLLGLSMLSTLASASHEILYPENSSYYHFGQPKEVNVKFKCLTDGSESQYTRFFDPVGNPLGTKIDFPFNSKEFQVLGPTLDLKLDYKNRKIIKSEESGIGSNGKKIISIYEVVEVDDEFRPKRSKSYQFFEDVNNNVNRKASGELEIESKDLEAIDDEALSYEMIDTIALQRKINSSKVKRKDELEFTKYKNNYVYKEEKNLIHEYEYFNSLYVQRDISVDGDKTLSIQEVAVEVNDNNQIASVMFKENGSDDILIHQEKFYDDNDRLILDKRIDGVSYEFKYYDNGLLKKYTKFGFLNSLIYSFNYNYPEIDSCGNPIVQEINYYVPTVRDESQYIPNYCPQLIRKYSYTYHQSCS